MCATASVAGTLISDGQSSATGLLALQLCLSHTETTVAKLDTGSNFGALFNAVIFT